MPITAKRVPALVSVCLLGAMLGPLASGAGAAWKAIEQPELKQKLDKVPMLNVEDVCTPVRSTRMERLLRVPNPDGKTWDLLQLYAPWYGGPLTVVIMDTATGEVKLVQTKRGPNIHLAPWRVAPNGKLYISVLDHRLHQQICIYDPATNELKISALKIPEDLRGETHPLVLGTDGKLYMIGAHPSKRANACQIDPATNKVTSYGPIGPSHAPNGCWGYSGGADDRYIYIASGKIPWYLVAYDRQTGKSKVLLTTEKVGGIVSVRQYPYGCTASASKVLGTDGRRREYWLYQGKAILRKDPRETPPWPQPKGKKPPVTMPPKIEVMRTRAVPDVDGNAEIWYRTAEAKAAAPKNPPQNATLEQLGWKVLRFKVPLYPQRIYRLMALPDGRLFGTAGAYEGNFLYDPKTDKAVHMGKIHLSHYATAFYQGKIYMSGYPTSPLYVYDPSKPWTANTEISPGRSLGETDPRSNPRLLIRLGRKEYAGTHKMYAAVTGADGKVYFGGKWVRDGAAGGLAWWDPKAKKAGGFWKPFSNYQINFMTTAADGKYLVISTMCISDSLLGKPRPEQGKIFLYDTLQHRIVREIEPVMKAKGAGLVAGVGGSRVLGWTENPADPKKSSILYGVDAKTGEVAFRKVLPFPLPVRIGSNQKEAFDYRLGPDGKVWTFLGRTLVRINPTDGKILPVGRVARGGRIAFSGPDIYLSGSPALRRIRNVPTR